MTYDDSNNDCRKNKIWTQQPNDGDCDCDEAIDGATHDDATYMQECTGRDDVEAQNVNADGCAEDDVVDA